MTALRGEDPSIKSQIAFASFKKIITAFQFDGKELQILKELIICDKLVEDNLFCEQISLINFFAIESKSNSESNPFKEITFKIFRLFWRVIKDKSVIMNDNDHIFQQKRSQRYNYLQKLRANAILNQIGTIESLFSNIFELIYYLQNPNYFKQKEVIQWRKYGIIQYIIVHLLYKLFYLYNCQTIMQKYFISKILQLNQGQLFKLKRCLSKSRQNFNKFIIFIKEHEGVKGFQHVNYEDIKVQINQKLIQFIDDYLHNLENSLNEPIVRQLPINLGKMKVQKKASTNCGRFSFFPRLLIKEKPSKAGQEQSNPFVNWQNSYNHQFPQKEVMTVDLILQIKLEQSLNRQSQEQQIDQHRDDNIYLNSRCSFDNRSTCTSSSYCLNFFKIKEYAINVLEKRDFSNIYSKVAAKWNQS